MGEGAEIGFYDVEKLDVYQKLCDLHIEVCDLSHEWPAEEKYELGSQVRRSSNSSPAQLAEKNNDRHIRNRLEGVNRSRGEARETLHHLFMAKRKSYLSEETYIRFREEYTECIRMLNGLERYMEQHLSEKDKRWTVSEENNEYDLASDSLPSGFPVPSGTDL